MAWKSSDLQGDPAALWTFVPLNWCPWTSSGNQPGYLGASWGFKVRCGVWGGGGGGRMDSGQAPSFKVRFQAFRVYQAPCLRSLL